MTIDYAEDPCQTLCNLSHTLRTYHDSSAKFVNSQAAAAIISNLCSSTDITFEAVEKLPTSNIDGLFKESARNLINEILEYRDGRLVLHDS
jgi:hypothetical protein